MGVAALGGSYVFVANMGDGTVSVIDTGTNHPNSITVGEDPDGVAVSPDNKTAYVTNSGDGTVSVVTDVLNVTGTIDVGSNPKGVAVSPDSSTAYVTNSGDGTVSVLADVPATVPGAPTDLAATSGDGKATVGFSPPAGDGGAMITGYTATASPGGLTGTCANSPCTVSGLTNGTGYTFTVAAINSVGAGPASAASNSVTPQASQTITFAAPGTGMVGRTQMLNATASSGLTVAFIVDASSTSGACTLAGATVTFTGAGSCVLDADQPGNAAYRAATRVQQSITVAAAPTPTPTPTPTPPPSSGAAMTLSNPAPDSQGEETFRVNGLQPGSTATFTLHSRPYLLGTVVVDSTGTARLTVTLPAGFTGAHEIVVQVTDANGAALTLSRPITISSATADTSADPGGTRLAATGVPDLSALLGTALGLLVTGSAVLLLAGRRRRVTGIH
jgi:YVTN family beta-propeller protein